MGQRKSDFTFPLNHILHVFLYSVFLDIAIKYLLKLKHAWAVAILNSAFDQAPHPFTLLSTDCLLDVSHTLVMLFWSVHGLGSLSGVPS